MKWSDFMKTRSKRFLNLATLCLALLSTTLLTTQPVKAEVTRSNQTHITTKSYEDSRKQGTDDGYEKGKKAASDETLNARDIVVPDGFDTQGYMDGYDGYSTNEDRDREFGQQKGIDDGKNGYWPNVNRQEITIPKGIDYPDEYRDGYQEGYSQGWHQEHPLLGVIFDVFDSIWNVMSGLFNGVN
ncbi:TPA: hypothetical protein VL637_001482 [Streptococcus pyogenes]|nr:hypothetical protein [Streptococcus pyogenes]